MCLGAFLPVAVCVAWLVGSSFLAPCNHAVDSAPRDLLSEAVSYQSDSGAKIGGWFFPADKPHAAILLLHGSGGDRTSMLTRARFLHSAGYASLSIDFRCHGESSGDYRTYGWKEARDAIGGVVWLRQRLPGAKVAVIGTSLGGAAALLARNELKTDALVVESVYSTLDQAVWNRVEMRVGAVMADCLSPLLSVQIPLRMGAAPADVSPMLAAATVRCPLLVIHGAKDDHAHLSEGRAIFDASPSKAKQWWEVPDAGHVDLCRLEGEKYQRTVLAFLSEALN